MGFATQSAAITDHIVDRFEYASVVTENTPFRPAIDPTTKEQLPWVRVSVRESGASNVERGGTDRRIRTRGIMIAQIFVPADSGIGAARELADRMAELIRNKLIENVRFRAPWPDPVGVDGPWYQLNLVAPYFADEIVED